MEDEEYRLVYHTRYARPLRGHLWLFVLLAIGAAVLFFSVVKVQMPQPLPRAQEGTLSYRNDDILHLQVLLRSPLPLPLPSYVDPARRDAGADHALPKRFVPHLAPAPPERIFSAAHDSAVLQAEDLMALPPVGLQDTPPSADGEEVQP